MVLKRFFEYLLFVAIALVLAGCGNAGDVLHSIDDLDDSRIAVLGHAVSDDDFEEMIKIN